MFKIVENTSLTKIYGFQITKNILIKLGFKTIKYLRFWIKNKYSFFDHYKKYMNIKVRTKGKFYQTTRKQYRIFLFIIGWDIKKEYEKRNVYTYFHKKKYLNQKLGLLEKIKIELKQALRS